MLRREPIWFTHEGERYLINPDKAAAYHIRNSTAKLKRLCDLIETTPEVVLDVGGNCGIFSAMVNRRFPSSRVFCFEPSKALLPIIRANCPHPNVVIGDYAVGDTDSTIDLHINMDSQQTNSVSLANVSTFADAARIRTVQVPCRTLNAVASEAGIARAQVLKIDVQGHEGAVLRGASNILPSVDYLFIESTWMDFESVTQLLPFAQRVGFCHVYVVNAVHMGADLLLTRAALARRDGFEREVELDRALSRDRWA